jgi:hypothetical protein
MIGAIRNTSDHANIHDLKLNRVSKDYSGPSFNRVIDGVQDDYSYVSVENVLCDDCAGYFWRGGAGSSPEEGPVRFSNVQRHSHGQDSEGTNNHLDIWGWTGQWEIIDSVFDTSNDGDWDSGSGGNGEIGFNVCAQDLHFVNNYVIDAFVGIQHSDSTFCTTGARYTGGGVLIDRNEFRITSNNGFNGIGGVYLNAQGNTGVNRLGGGDIVVTNNLLYDETTGGVQLQGLVHGTVDNTGEAYSATDSIIVANNTVMARDCFGNGGLVNIGASDTHKWRRYDIYNNVWKNLNGGADCENIGLTYAPETFLSDSNSFDAASEYRHNNTVYTSLTAFAAATGTDANSDECDPYFVDSTNHDYTPSVIDFCARDKGENLAATTGLLDFEGKYHGYGRHWDRGAIEFDNLGAFGLSRGYQPRANGMDFNDDFVYGEAGVDDLACDKEGGSAVSNYYEEDVDGDTVQEQQIFVDLDSGSDVATCGLPGSPCLTINYALNNRADGNGSNKEDIICVEGTGTSEPDDMVVDVSGATGVKTRPQSAHEDRAFEYPKDPMVIMGIDGDNDGVYPPLDPDDIAIVDGSGNDMCMVVTADRIEVAHMTWKSCGDHLTAIPGTGVIGFADSLDDHNYFHDLRLERITAERPTQSSNDKNFNFDNGANYLAVENSVCEDCGGFGFRGSPSAPTGPIRFTDYTRALMPGAAQTSSQMMDVWAEVDGIEFIRLVHDGNQGEWSSSSDNISAATLAQCARDLWVYDGLFIGSNAAGIEAQDSGFCSGAGARTTGEGIDLLFNEQFTHPDETSFSLDFFRIGDDGDFGPNRYGGVTVVAHNVSYPHPDNTSTQRAGFIRGRIDNTATAYDSGDQLLVYNNTVIANDCWNNGGLIDMDADSTHKLDHIEVYNNYFDNNTGTGDCRNITINWAPAVFESDYNSWDADSTYQWNEGTVRTTLGDWQTDSSEDANSRECEATYRGESDADYRITSADTCLLDNGTSLPANIPALDFFGNARPQLAAFDAGFHEFTLWSYGEVAAVTTVVSGGGGPEPPAQTFTIFMRLKLQGVTLRN